MVLVPAGTFGPEFVVTPNFYVIKEYNNSDLYALFIGNLADRIAHGVGAFVTPWRGTGSMLRSRHRQAAGVAGKNRAYDVGGADGLPGYKTRRSIGEWQGRKRRDTDLLSNACPAQIAALSLAPGVEPAGSGQARGL